MTHPESGPSTRHIVITRRHDERALSIVGDFKIRLSALEPDVPLDFSKPHLDFRIRVQRHPGAILQPHNALLAQTGLVNSGKPHLIDAEHTNPANEKHRG